jgi:HTH-type transcriptional regulator/antitoxin HigA
MAAPEEVRYVPEVLADAGVRFVVVEAFPGSKIDGACFWLSNTQPVIAMSLRLDRIDNFWFVLRHEIEHVLRGDGKDGTLLIDEDTGEAITSNLAECELAANSAASEFCVRRSDLDNYIQRVNPYYYSLKKVRGFAFRLGVHPGIVVGQLHNRFREFQYLRKQLVKVRGTVTQSASFDGWGSVFPV